MPKTLLIVDDSPMIRKLLAEHFRTHPGGFEGYEATDGMEAIEKFPVVKPDVVIMDFQMPRLDGLQAASKLRQMQFEVPIIMFTTYAKYVPESAAKSVGLVAVIEKPDLPALVQYVEKLLNQIA